MGLLAQRWMNDAALAAEETAHALDGTRREAAGLRAVQAEYAGLHRQPYTALAEELDSVVDGVEHEASELELAWQELSARREAKSGNPLRDWVQTAPNAYSQRQLAGELAQRRAGIEEKLRAGYGLIRRMETVPAEVAGRRARAGEGIRLFEEVLAGLGRAGLRGRLFEEADEALLQLQQAQARIPEQFTGSGEAAALRQTAGEVHDLLSGIEPLLGEWLPRVQGWEQQYSRLLGAGQQLQKTIAHFRAALGEAPAQLVLTHYQAALLKVSAAAGELENRSREAEIQDLRALERETSLLERTLQETAVRYDRTVLEVHELDRLLLQLESDFKLLAGRMAQTEIHETYPLAWDASRGVQNDLQEKIAALGRRDLKRTPEQVSQALAAGKEHQERLSGLLEKTREQSERYVDLVRLMETPELAQGAEWVQKTGQLAREIARYDPANWNRTDEVGVLVRDLNALDELQRRLVPAERPSAIKETGLARRLEETRQLAALHQKLRPRVERVRMRLAELRGQEQDARDELDRVTGTLDQLALLLNNNSYLQETAAVELSRLRGEAARLGEELGRPEAGTLEKKAQRLKVLQDGLSRAASGWLERLAANIQTHTRSIADGLAALDQVAALDDREVGDARELLRRLGLAPAYGRPETYMEAAVQLKRCATDWQSAAACAAALDACGQPVLAAARDADQARRSARGVFQSAARMAGGRREWPPARQSLEVEMEEFRVLETRLDGLHGQHWSAARLVRELGQLYHELDKIDDRAVQAVRAAETERAEAQEAERQVIELQRQWQGLPLRYPDQPGIGDGARDLVSQAEKRLAHLRAQYRRGSMDYDQVLAGLQELAQGLRGARFSTKDGKSVGIEV